jgi:hypothetical protein
MKNPEREERIHNEIIVDAYGEEEQAMSWYYYLKDNLAFPFKAKCSAEIRKSPLKIGETVKVWGMASEEDCEHDMLVMIDFKQREMAVPLKQLEPLKVDEETLEAVKDWHYWIEQGYQF